MPFLYHQYNLMLSFSVFGPAAITKIDALSIFHAFEYVVPFGLLQSNNATITHCCAGCQQGVDVADSINVVDRYYAKMNMPDVSSSNRDLTSSFIWGAYLTARFLRRFNDFALLGYITTSR